MLPAPPWPGCPFAAEARAAPFPPAAPTGTASSVAPPASGVWARDTLRLGPAAGVEPGVAPGVLDGPALPVR